MAARLKSFYLFGKEIGRRWRDMDKATQVNPVTVPGSIPQVKWFSMVAAH